MNSESLKYNTPPSLQSYCLPVEVSLKEPQFFTKDLPQCSQRSGTSQCTISFSLRCNVYEVHVRRKLDQYRRCGQISHHAEKHYNYCIFFSFVLSLVTCTKQKKEKRKKILVRPHKLSFSFTTRIAERCTCYMYKCLHTIVHNY